jgi:mannose-6-phosphate isomerase
MRRRVTRVDQSNGFKQQQSSRDSQLGADYADTRISRIIMKPSILSTPIKVERRPWGFFSLFIEDKVASPSWLADFFSELEPIYHPKKGELLQHEPGEPLTVKIIHVYARSRLSLQYHRNRTEEWYCLKGRAYAILNRDGLLDRIPLEKGSHVIVPQMAVHRLGCDDESADILEVSKGHFDEADIVRVEDDYRVLS